VILDEPFSGLDPINRRLLRGLIDEQHKAGRTLIFSTHAMFEAEQLCDRLFMIHKGVKVLDDRLDDVWSRYDPRTVEIEPMAPLAQADAGAFRDIPGVRKVEVGAKGIELHVSDPGAAAGVMALAAARMPARRVEVKRPSLEDIFITLVGGESETLRDELKSASGVTKVPA
jgi:ABC-2 type transport system ATP-binding protein